MHACVHTYRYVQVQACEAQRTMLHVFLYHFPHHLVKQGLSSAMELTKWLVWLASKFQRSTCLHLPQPSARSEMSAIIPSCCMAAEGQTLTTAILY